MANASNHSDSSASSSTTLKYDEGIILDHMEFLANNRTEIIRFLNTHPEYFDVAKKLIENILNAEIPPQLATFVRNWIKKNENKNKESKSIEEGKLGIDSFDIKSIDILNITDQRIIVEYDNDNDNIIKEIRSELIKTSDESKLLCNVINNFLGMSETKNNIISVKNKFIPSDTTFIVRYRCCANIPHNHLESKNNASQLLRCTKRFEIKCVGYLIRVYTSARGHNKMNKFLVPYPSESIKILYNFDLKSKVALLQWVDDGDNVKLYDGNFKYPHKLLVLPRHYAHGLFVCSSHRRYELINPNGCPPVKYTLCQNKICINHRKDDGDRRLKLCKFCSR